MKQFDVKSLKDSQITVPIICYYNNNNNNNNNNILVIIKY
jgi:hypothetical protein